MLLVLLPLALTPESVPFFAPPLLLLLLLLLLPAPFFGRSGMVMDTDDGGDDDDVPSGTGAGSRGRLRDILPVDDGSSCCITTAEDASLTVAIVDFPPSFDV